MRGVKVQKDMGLARDLQLHKAKEKDHGNVLLNNWVTKLLDNCEKTEASSVSSRSFSF